MRSPAARRGLAVPLARLATVLCLSLGPGVAAAQDAGPEPAPGPGPPPVSAATPAADSIRPADPPFAASVAAGTLGSGAGALLFGAMGSRAVGGCAPENPSCIILGGLAGGAIGSVAGSVAATHLLARRYGQSPSLTAEVLASTLGGVIGTLVGFGLVNATSDGDLAPFMVGFAITQGALTAFASRSSARAR